MKKQYLLTPGPTPVPPNVLAAEAKPVIHHRTPQFQDILKEAEEGLKYVFQTKEDVYIFASSGTGAMESAVCNILSPRDSVITIQGGKFGERWTEICKAYNAAADAIDVPFGEDVDIGLIKSKLKANPGIKAVFATLCETSAGTTFDIKSLAEAVKDSPAVLVVDAISGLGAVDIKTDDWGVDMVVSGSQKGLMLAPGLSFITVSRKAWKLVGEAKSPRYYFDLLKAKKAIEKTDTPFTPAISLVVALNESLRMIRQDGLEAIFARHKVLASATRAAVLALGLELLAPKVASDAVTAAKLPAGIDGEKLVKTMRDTYGVTIAGGQEELKGKIVRIAHMGYITEFDIIVGVACLEKVLAQMGYKFGLGSGVKAAQEVFLKSNF